MSKITLPWNSRTPENRIFDDSNYKSIVDFIKAGKSNEWIVNFFCYDNVESEALREKLKGMLSKQCTDANFMWKEFEIHFYSEDSQSQVDRILRELDALPDHQSGIVMLYQSIDFGYIISRHTDKKLEIHKQLAEIFEQKKLILFLFGNIPYDLHYSKENSPLTKFVWKEFEICAYRKEDIDILKQIESHIDETVLEYSGGNFELVHGVESFLELVKLNERVTDLVKNFYEVPLKTKTRKLVNEKLLALSSFLEKNQSEIGGKIEYVENNEIRIIKEDETQLIKDYFDKTALFDTEERDQQLVTHYVLQPKKIFEEIVHGNGFIEGKGKIKTAVSVGENYENDFAQIAACFEFRSPIFILGAGNSMTAGAPDRKRLFREILSQIFPNEDFETMPYKELKRRFQELISGHARDDIRWRVMKFLDDLSPSIGHFLLAKLVKSEKIAVRTFITTNFDTLIEDSLMDYGIRSRNFLKMVSKENIDLNEWKWVNQFPQHLKLFKICGDVYYGSWLAVDDNAANCWIENTVKAINKVTAFNESNFFIILGHKFEEIDLYRLFDNKESENLVIVYANPDESDCEKFRDKFSAKCIQLHIVSGKMGEFDNFMEKLCEHLKRKGLV